jgi:DNA-binding LacI/PurR family transcriptional regulator
VSKRLRNRFRDEEGEPEGRGWRRVQLADVARRAEVSLSTASRALNGRGELSPATRAAVLRAAEELGFRPSPFARSLRTQRSSIVGLVVPDVAHPFYAAVLKGAQAVLEEAGYGLILLDTRGDSDHVDDALDTLLDHRAEGILVATSEVGAERMAEIDAQIPCVFIDDVLPQAGVGSVLVENRAGVEMLVEHLVEEHGHRRIGLLAGASDTSGSERLEGFQDALAAHGLKAGAGAIRPSAWTIADGFREGLALLDLRSRPTAVVVASAELALGFLAAARSRGVTIPADLALVAFDDPVFAALLEPALTAVAYDATAMGAAAARMLVGAIGADDAPYRTERVGVRLMARRSCGCDHDLEAQFREVPT